MHSDAPQPGDSVWIDWINECVWRGGEAVRLTPKAYAVLRTLTAQAGQLVSKEALLQAVWPEAVVSEGVLTGCIGELRKALGETARAAQWIQTVHRRGYRFVGPASRLELGERRAPLAAARPRATIPSALPPLGAPASQGASSRAVPIIGRAVEMAQLHQALAQAWGGTRQVVFVTGEPGLGKTTVVQTFVEQVTAAGGVWIASGQCLEAYGAGEAYLPVLEALGRLCRLPGSEALRTLLEQQAPTWLAQMPALLSAEALEAVQRRVLGATRERMVREMVEVLDTFTQDHPLVLVLEDLHWSDAATLNLLSALARRPEPARLLLLGTYRPVEVIVHHHPLKALKQDLEVRHQCLEIPLELLSAAEVAQYLAARFAAGEPLAVSLQALARTLHQRTDGNPLFLVTVVDDLMRQGVVRAAAGQWEVQGEGAEVSVRIPESLRRMIAQQCDALSPQEQQVLEAASVAGTTCSAAAVAAGIETEVEVVEACCAALAQRGQFLEASGLEHWPDGTIAECYRWRHTLYQEVIYDRVSAGRRLRLHRRIGQREEAGYGTQAEARAAALAEHFVRGQDPARAGRYLQQAAQNALQRYAYQETIGHLTRGLEVLKSLPATPERVQQELTMQASLGMALMDLQGYSAPDVEHAYTRARKLCQQVGDSLQLFPVLMGLVTFYRVRAEYQIAWELMEQALRLAERLGDPALLVQSHAVLGGSFYYCGELSLARAHLEQGLTLYAPEQHHPLAFHFGVDPGVECYDFLARSLWYLGYPEQARQRVDEALTLAQERGHPPSLVMARQHAGTIFQLRREAPAAHTQAEAAVALATEHALPYWLACGLVVHGWARAMQGQGAVAVTQIRQGLADLLAMNIRMTVPYFLGLLAEACGQAGLTEAGLAALAEAFTIVHQTGERCHEAELYRLKGELLLRAGVPRPKGNILTPDPSLPPPDAAAETCFHQALTVARHQQSKSLELRAGISLSRLWQQQGKQAAAYELLAPLYGWFTEGFDTADLQEARVLLAELT